MNFCNILPGDHTQDERDIWFLHLYATALRKGKEREIEIPSVMATILDGIAQRIEERRQPMT